MLVDPANQQPLQPAQPVGRLASVTRSSDRPTPTCVHEGLSVLGLPVTASKRGFGNEGHILMLSGTLMTGGVTSYRLYSV